VKGLFATALLIFAGAANSAPQAPSLGDFARRPQIDYVRLSPDGELLAVSMQKNDGTTIAFLKAADLAPVAHWDLGEKREAHSLKWVSDDRIVFRLGIRRGALDQTRRVPGLFTLTKHSDDLKRYPAGAPLLGEPVPGSPGWVYGFRQTGGGGIGSKPQLLKFNIENGFSARLMVGPADFGTFIFDSDGRVRYFVGGNRDLSRVVARRDGDRWIEVFRGSEEQHHESPGLLAPNGTDVYVWRTGAKGILGVWRLETATGEYHEVSSDPRYDAAEMFVASDRKTLLGVRYQGLRPRMHLVAPEHPEAKLYLALQKSFGDANLQVLDRSRDGRRWLVSIDSDRDPGQIYIFDRERGQARLLYAHREWLDPADLAKVRTASYKARDGKMIDAYLWVPPGRESSRLPLIVRPHGGPFGIRDVHGFDAEAQVLATRGFAVLSMNFRGSGGYGTEFLREGHGEWGRRMIHDMSDGVRWAIAQGVADPDRICIFGASYGAYAAMMSVILEPDLYRCAVGYSGMYDIPTMESYSDDSIYLRNFFDKVYPQGDHERESQSPARRASEVRVPVMLAHGTKDFVTPLEQFDVMARALRKAGNPAEVTLLKSGEGHGFEHEDNVVEFHETLLAFLDKHIGDRSKDARKD
jgi:dipeptidyl aminopeptidase/acylaminoacyl peptidase